MEPTTGHTGSWGTKDYGVTEWISNLIGGTNQTNNTGGSNLVGQYQVTPQEQGTIDYVNQINQATPQYPQLSGSQNLSRISSNPSSVLGASTTGGGNTGGGGGGTDRAAVEDAYRKMGWTDMNAAWADAQATNFSKLTGQSGSSGPSYEDQMRGQIDSGYNNYFSELDNMLGGLDTQKQAQENIANIQSSQQISDLGASTQQNIGKLEGEKTNVMNNQVKTLKDISSNIRNLLQAGNTYLGSRGAGDSSAVNQYGYATTKLGSQQRGDVMGQTRQILSTIGSKIADVNNIFTQEKNRIQSELGVKVQEIATWFADAQNQLRQAKAQGQLAKSADLQALTTNLYNQAVQQLTNIQNQTAQRQSQLESWALNNSKSLAEAKANLAGIAQYSAPTQSYSAISGTPQFDQQGNMGVDFRGGVGTGFGLTEDERRLLGR